MISWLLVVGCFLLVVGLFFKQDLLCSSGSILLAGAFCGYISSFNAHNYSMSETKQVPVSVNKTVRPKSEQKLIDSTVNSDNQKSYSDKVPSLSPKKTKNSKSILGWIVRLLGIILLIFLVIAGFAISPKLGIFLIFLIGGTAFLVVDRSKSDQTTKQTSATSAPVSLKTEESDSQLELPKLPSTTTSDNQETNSDEKSNLSPEEMEEIKALSNRLQELLKKGV